VLRVGSISAADLDLAPKLKITSRNGTGCDTIDLEACRQRGVVVTNHPGGNAQVREHDFSLKFG
jgi:D-3-phosphoglycerate dehydrogenase